MTLALFRLIPLVLAWGGCYGLCRELAARGRIESDRRMSILFACAIWGVLLTGITELSSLFQSLNRTTLLVSWIFVSVILWTWTGRLARDRGRLSWRAATEFLSAARSRFSEAAGWPMDIRLMFLASVLLVLFLGAVAFLTPTSNWDSFTYHLPRVMHWVKQQSVAHYRTGCIGQLQMGPWAAFVQAHLFVLWGNDRLANGVQWWAMIGCLMVCSLLTRQLIGPRGANGRSRRAQVFTALLVTTLPTGLVESISTQTDYTVAFWVACSLGALLALLQNAANVWYLLAAGATVGLAFLTKITAVFYAAPLWLAAFVWWVFRLRAPGRIVPRALLWMTVSCLLMLPHSLRNRQLYGTVVGAPSTQQSGMNQRWTVAGTLSNLIRNAALHTDTGIRPLSRALNRGLEAIHSLTGRTLDDPDTTVYRDSFSFKEDFKIDDSTTGNPYHLALILAVLAMAVARPKENRELLAYALFLTAGAVLFCVVLRWQPWHSRYHLPYFVLFMPVVSGWLAARGPRGLESVLATWLTLFAGAVIAANQSRPVFNPAYLAQSRLGKMLFLQGPMFLQHLETMSRDVRLSGCSKVGLKLNSDDAEYPFWVALRNGGFTGRIDHAYVDNETAVLPGSGASCCVLLMMSKEDPPRAASTRLRYRTDYGVVKAYWSEEASRWSELEQFDMAASISRNVCPTDKEFLFYRRLIKFYLRTPRAGRLHLSGLVTDAVGRTVTNQLRITTYSGFEQAQTLEGRPVSLTIPSPGGQCAITLALWNPQGPNEARLRQVKWSWEPD